MRTCPVCGARCFDDMEVCYGCMHRFDERDEAATAVLRPLAKELATPEVSSTASASSLAGDSGTPPTAETVAGRSFPLSPERMVRSSVPCTSEADAGVACGRENTVHPPLGQTASVGQEAHRPVSGPTRQFMQGMTVSSPPFFLNPAEGSQRYQLVISLRPCSEGVG